MNFKIKWVKKINFPVVFRGFNFKPGFWIAKGSDGYLYAGSGCLCNGLLYTYRLHKHGNPEPMGWL
jgi:hypothetical protein